MQWWTCPLCDEVHTTNPMDCESCGLQMCSLCFEQHSHVIEKEN